MLTGFLVALICGLLGFVCSCVTANETPGFILKFKSNGKKLRSHKLTRKRFDNDAGRSRKKGLHL